MKKILFLISLVLVLVSCKDGILVNQYDKGVNMVLGGENSNDKSDTIKGDTTIVINGVTMKFIKVEGGTFQMGADESEAIGSEKPKHSVTLSDYYIGVTEVTQALWVAVMGNNPSYFKGDNLPVEQVSWNECQEFIQKLNQFTGQQFSLPTEAQWEFAALGGNKSRGYKYSGSDNIESVAWCYDNSSSVTHPVCTKQPNELGIYDMSGNVWEWCHDYYGTYSSSSQTNPTGPSSGSSRVVRGGSWTTVAWNCSSKYRSLFGPDDRHNHTGLRLVLQVATDTTGTVATDTIGTVTYESGKALLTISIDSCIVKANLIKVEGGTFQMGSDDSEAGSDEKPVHNVTLSDYYIGETEVTEALWEAVMGHKIPSFLGDNLPVEGVMWDECQEFIQKLNKLTGQTFSLPTEAQWEFAARGGNKSRGHTYSGSNTIGDVAWYADNSSSQTHSVGTKQANELGIYDMSGNVWEWCQDWYGIYNSYSETNPTGPSSGSDRVIRGGSYNDDTSFCCSTERFYCMPEEYFCNLGLRLVLLP